MMTRLHPRGRENELGEIGIDGGLIERTDLGDIVELTAGCICCTIRGDFLIGLRRVLQRDEPLVTRESPHLHRHGA